MLQDEKMDMSDSSIFSSWLSSRSIGKLNSSSLCLYMFTISSILTTSSTRPVEAFYECLVAVYDAMMVSTSVLLISALPSFPVASAYHFAAIQSLTCAVSS